MALCWLASASGAAAASTAPATKLVRYRGERLVVPASWPVYRLWLEPTVCVRFNRHAVYLGRPGPVQRCPAHTAGRTEAVLVEPLAASISNAGVGLGAPLARSWASVPSSAQLVDAARGVIVTATWSRQPGLIERALGVRSLAGVGRMGAAIAATAPTAQTAAAASAPTTTAPVGTTATSAPTASALGSIYTGLGFDACTAPSSSQMAAWGASPYRAIGVYIGGANMACSQVNLTSTWVAQQAAAGWHLVPIYVGLQAPSNDCGCAPIAPASATAEGTAAAQDAVAQAQAIGVGAGSPLYYDMEGYAPSAATTAAVLAFLASWTGQLHASGYESGVYGSADSGIRDLVSQAGSAYQEPDEIWIADWNGAQTTADANVPSAEWASHQRLHQYDGAHDETYGGVTINIDGDYLDAATAAAAGTASGAVSAAIDSAPELSVSPAADGSIDLYPSWSGAGGAGGVGAWQVLAGSTPASLVGVAAPVAAGAKPPIVIRSAFPYFGVRALGSAGQTLASSGAVATPAHVAIFGQAAFVPRHGIGGVPVGCLRPAPCLLTTTISAGRTTLARTDPEQVPVGGGLAFFALSQSGHALVARAGHRGLAVNVTVRDASGARATRQLKLIGFMTSGAGPQRSVHQSSALKLVGSTEFVSGGWVGGILAGCFAASPCRAAPTITSAGAVIARAQPQTLGVDELGYLFFTLSDAGHAALLRSRGNQLAATVAIAGAGSSAGARIALTAF
ncbi:MAG: glycoside hydrolase domain-containing protein [Solirubrobacteraceae bacterium]